MTNEYGRINGNRNVRQASHPETDGFTVKSEK